MDTTVNGNLTSGQQDTYTFNLPANALLYFDALTDNGNFQWSLTGPRGATVSNRSFGASDGQGIPNPVLALPTGSYTLTVSATGPTAGAYSFRLSDLATATPLTRALQSAVVQLQRQHRLPVQRLSRAVVLFREHFANRRELRNDWKLIDPTATSCSTASSPARRAG